MKNYPAVSVFVFLLLTLSRVAAQADEDIPIHVQKLADRAIVLRVADNPGGWMFHCHILEHQAAGMMSVVQVV